MKRFFKTMAFTLLGLVLSVNLMAKEGDEVTSLSKIVSGTSYYFKAVASSTDYYLSFEDKASTSNVSGTAETDKGKAIPITITVVDGGYQLTTPEGNYLAPATSNGKLTVTSAAKTVTASEANSKLKFSIKNNSDTWSIQKNSSGTQMGGYKSNQTAITLIEAAGSTPSSYTITAQSNNTTYGTVSLSGSVITASPKTGYRVNKTTPYNVISGEAEVMDNGDNTFTVTPSKDCTVQINFETIPMHKVYWSQNGVKTQYDEVAEGAAITFPETATGCDGKTFMGWYNDNYSNETTAPEYVTSAIMGNSEITYYAVFADENEGGGTTSVTKDIIDEGGPSSSVTLNADNNPYQMGELPITLTGIKGESNFPAINVNASSGTDLRFYKGTTCGVTFATTNSQPITKIEFKKNSTTNSNLNTYFSANVGTLSSNVWTGSATSVTITYNNTATFKEQMYIVNVTYSEAGGTTYSNYTTQCSAPTYAITVGITPGQESMGSVVLYDTDLNPVEGGMAEFVEGDEIAILATPETGYEFNGWTMSPEDAISDIDLTDDDPAFTVGTKAATLTASFRLIPTVTYDITINQPTGATISASKETGIAAGDEVTLSYELTDGYKFTAWDVKQGETPVTVTENKFNMPAGNVTITATITKLTEYTITWKANGVAVSGGTAKVYEGDAITALPTITETCDPAIKVVGWTKNENYKNATTAPSDMFSTVVDAPEITGNTTFYAVYATVKEQAASWTKSSLASMTTSDIFVIEAAGYALPNATATSSSPAAIAITLSEDENSIISEVTDDLKWYFSGNSTDGYTFHAAGAESDRWLYESTTSESKNNDKIRVGAPTGTNTNRNKWVVEDGTSGVTYLATKDDYTKRYLSMYNNADWRGYLNTDNGNPVIYFFKYNAPVSETTDYSTTCAAPVTIAKPVFLTDSKTYTEATAVKFNAVAEGVDIYYNINTDARPTTSDNKYNKTNGIVLNVNGTYVIRAIAADANGNESEDVAYRSFTIQLPFTSIEALQADAEINKNEHEVAITFNNWIVTAVSGSNVYFEDADGKGILLYQSSNGFDAGDQISGTLTGVLNLLYNGAAELKNFKKTTTGLTVTSGQTVPVFTPSISEIDENNQGAVVKLSNVTYNLENNVLSDGTNTIVPYNKFYSDMSLSDGAKYNVTGVIIAYYSNSTFTMEIAPRKAEDIEIILNKLDAPENVKVKEGTITKNSATIQWDAVVNASSYAISIDGGTAQNVGNVTEKEVTGLTSSTEYSVTVTAVGDQITYSNSDASQEVKFTTIAPAEFYTVAYSVKNGNVVAGAPEQVAEAGTITMPDVENVSCPAGYEFIGWTMNKDYATSNTKPTDLKAAGETSAAINNNITFYAVYGLEKVVSTTFADFVDDNTMTSADFVIAAKIKQDDESYKYFALANTGSDKKPTGIDITKNGEVDADKLAANKLTFEKSTTEAGYYSISLNTNPIKYFGWSSSTDFGSSTTVTDNYLWSVSEGKYGTYRIINKGSSSRAIVYRTGTQNCFGPYSTSNINGTEYFDVEVLPVPTQVGTYSLNPDCKEERALELESSNGVNLNLDATTDQVSTTISAKANTGSEGALTLSCSQEGVSISETTVTFSKAGSYTIKANQAATATYAAVKANIEITVANATITITYDGNGATEGVPTAAQIEKGSKLTVDEGSALVNGEKTFVNWKDNDNNYYTPGEEYTFTASLTLVAQWADKAGYTITYTAGEGQLIGGKTEPTPAEFAPAAEATVASNEWYEKSDYHFLGWKCNEQLYMPNTQFSMPAEDLTMVAQWEQDGTVGGDLVVLVAPYTTYESVVEYYALQSTGEKAMKPLQISGIAAENKAKVIPSNQSLVSWYKMDVVGGVIFRNAEGKYLAGGGTTSLSQNSAQYPFVWEWNGEKECYANSNRTPLYRNTGVFGNYSVNNIKASDYSDVLIIADGFAPADYGRTDLVVGNYGTVCVPYTVTAANRSGATFWNIETSNAPGYANPTSVTIVQEEGDLEAGKPYIFCATETEMTMFFSGEEYKLEEHENATVPANGLYGNLTDGTITINPTTYVPGFFFVLQQKLYECGTNCTVAPNRGWVQADKIEDKTTPSPAPRRVIGNPKGTPTGIDNLNTDGWKNIQGARKYLHNNHIMIVNEGRIYNAQGQLVK